MKRNLAALAATTVAAFAASPASAQITAEAARVALTPFYEALNAASGKDAAELIRQSTAPEWVTCRGNDQCNTRDEVMAGIGPRLKAIPDLKWEIKEVLVSGNRIIVRGEATGTPAGKFMGVATNGKSFKLMSIDVHTLENGKVVRTWHVEDWQGAFRQLSE
jgi:predicted ester cyclase